MTTNKSKKFSRLPKKHQEKFFGLSAHPKEGQVDPFVFINKTILQMRKQFFISFFDIESKDIVRKCLRVPHQLPQVQRPFGDFTFQSVDSSVKFVRSHIGCIQQSLLMVY